MISDSRRDITIELLAQLFFQQLAGGAYRYGIDKCHIVWRPSLDNFVFKKFQQLARAHVQPWLPDHQQWPLIPLRMEDTNVSHLQRRMRHHDIFQIDTADPLATRLDYILAALGDLHIAIDIDNSDVADRKPIVAKHLAAFVLEVSIDHLWPTY